MKIVREEFEQDIYNLEYAIDKLNNYIKKHNIKREDIISIKTIKNYPLTIELYYNCE
jgi:hypothetical protein